MSLAFRYRRAGTTERAQLKWLVYAAAMIVMAALAQIPTASNNLQNAISIGAVALVPVAIGIAVPAPDSCQPTPALGGRPQRPRAGQREVAPARLDLLT